MAKKIRLRRIHIGRYSSDRIKFRSIKPGSPQLKGKVKRTQQTDLDEFYSTVDIKYPNLPTLLSHWQFHYNCFRSHSSLNGCAPIQVINTLSNKTLLWVELSYMYDSTKERIKDQN
ncbi:integrase core domain-containing protein [Sphingobacterium faecium]|uniref:integrase core domain-containing protein n=1 Tax=Sphingobacterium faecium TaxID=34087 RepID=UPI003D35F1CD